MSIYIYIYICRIVQLNSGSILRPNKNRRVVLLDQILMRTRNPLSSNAYSEYILGIRVIVDFSVPKSVRRFLSHG